MSAPDTRCLVAARVQLQQAHEHVLTACKVLRTNGFPESADDLMRSARGLHVWIQREGWIDALDREPIPVREAAE